MTQINIEIEKIYERIKKAFQKLKYMQKFKKEGKYKFDASFSLSIWTKKSNNYNTLDSINQK